MSKTKYNVVNPDELVQKYGADTLRMYEMFLGPLEQFKPWSTHGIDGVFKFLRKFWNLFHKDGSFKVTDDAPTAEELKILHKTIKKVEDDVDALSFNTTVSAFMICVNELTAVGCDKRQILEPLVITLSPYAPHLSEELWVLLGNKGGLSAARYPAFDAKHVEEAAFEYPVSVNGKTRVKLKIDVSASKEEIEAQVLANEVVQKWLEGKVPKKVIVVPKRIVNVVI